MPPRPSSPAAVGAELQRARAALGRRLDQGLLQHRSAGGRTGGCRESRHPTSVNAGVPNHRGRPMIFADYAAAILHCMLAAMLVQAYFFTMFFTEARVFFFWGLFFFVILVPISCDDQ
jgi:hypothetical protein